MVLVGGGGGGGGGWGGGGGGGGGLELSQEREVSKIEQAQRGGRWGPDFGYFVRT